MLLLGAELVRRGNFASVICTQEEGALADSARESGVDVIVSPFSSRWDNVFPARLTRELAGVSPDLIHSQNGVWLAAALAARRLNVPLCHTEHGMQSMREPFRVTSQKYMAARLTDAVVAVSTPLLNGLHSSYHIPNSRLSRIDNGIPTDRFSLSPNVRAAVRSELGVSDDTIVVGAVARLHHLKGIDLLMEAARGIVAHDHPVCIVVAGDGEDRQLVESLALRSAVPVKLLGMRRDVHRLLQAFDVFALPSRSEGLPLAVLEAMAAECAVIATDVGEVARVLAGESGLVVARHDVTAFTDGLNRLLRDEALRHTLSANALKSVQQHYSISRMTDDYVCLYRQVLATTSDN